MLNLPQKKHTCEMSDCYKCSIFSKAVNRVVKPTIDALKKAIKALSDRVTSLEKQVGEITTIALTGIQAKLTTATTIDPTTIFIPLSTVVTNNNNNMTIAPNVGQITVNVTGTYLIGWIAQSDDDASVALTINGNLSTQAPVGSSLLALEAGNIVALANLGTETINVTFAQLSVTALS